MAAAHQRFRPAPGVLFTPIDDQLAALISTERTLPYSLNATGLVVWRTLESGAGLEQIVAALTGEFDICEDQARQDTEAFLRDLLAFELIERAERTDP